MKRKPFLPDTPVRLIATPATTSKVVRHLITDGTDHYVVAADADGTESTVDGVLLEVNPGAVPDADFPYNYND